LWTRGDEVASDHHLLTVREVADDVRVSTMTVYRLIKSGALPAIRVGKHFRIREADLSRYLETQTTVPGGGQWPAA
jgi:excisionase family DNA binding protein